MWGGWGISGLNLADAMERAQVGAYASHRCNPLLLLPLCQNYTALLTCSCWTNASTARMVQC